MLGHDKHLICDGPSFGQVKFSRGVLLQRILPDASE